MAYLIFSLSLLLIYIGLAQMLHVQFGLLGIPNFGVVGFWGLGMYADGVMQVQLGMSFVDSMVLSGVVLALVSYGLGHLILRLERQAILCATIAFSAIIALLAVTEKWMTMGVVGLGTIRQPFRIFGLEEILFFLFLVVLIGSLQFLILKLHKSRLGRLMIAVRDNQELAASLGKDTFQVKLIAFTITATIMGLLGGLSAPLNQFLTPNMIVPSITFAVWISLVLGGKEHAYGPMLGVFVTFGLFDILIETYAPVSPEFAVVVPNLKLFLYGALLVGVLIFRPRGILEHNAKPDQPLNSFERGLSIVAEEIGIGFRAITKGSQRLLSGHKKEDDA
ncbi:MAG: branched-chain amino acid ABC transporter permease [Hyphomicrobiales bacterium]